MCASNNRAKYVLTNYNEYNLLLLYNLRDGNLKTLKVLKVEATPAII